MINNVIKKLKGFTRALTVSAGFTLVETLIAVLLLATAVAGPLTIASKSLLAALVAKDQVTAFFLAQDAVEYVRFARDTNKLHGVGWDWLNADDVATTPTNLSSCTGATGCFLDSTGNTVNSSGHIVTGCGANSCINATTFASSRFICYDTNTSRFRYVTQLTCGGVSGVERTAFARQVTITPPLNNNPGERLLTVTVSWTDTANKVRSVTVRENIFDWQ